LEQFKEVNASPLLAFLQIASNDNSKQLDIPSCRVFNGSAFFPEVAIAAAVANVL
jgi:hypothetical protein